MDIIKMLISVQNIFDVNKITSSSIIGLGRDLVFYGKNIK